MPPAVPHPLPGPAPAAAAPVVVRIGARHERSCRPLLQVAGEDRAWGAGAEDATFHAHEAAAARARGDRAAAARHAALAGLRAAFEEAEGTAVTVAAQGRGGAADVRLHLPVPAAALLRGRTPSAAEHAEAADDAGAEPALRVLHWRCAEAHRLLARRADAHAWARRMLRPGAAVVLDTETTGLDGYACEVAVRDATTGALLLHSLLHPPVPIEAGAAAVHGLSDADLAAAPRLAQVWDRLLAVTRGRTVLAWKAVFDEAVLRRHAAAEGLPLHHLGEPERWQCLMHRDRDHRMSTWFAALGGGHRAAADCSTARERLRALAAPGAGAVPAAVPAPRPKPARGTAPAPAPVSAPASPSAPAARRAREHHLEVMP